MGPGSRPWLLQPFGGYGGVRSHPTGPAAALSRGDEHRRNTVGLPAKANSVVIEADQPVGLATSGLHVAVVVCVH